MDYPIENYRVILKNFFILQLILFLLLYFTTCQFIDAMRKNHNNSAKRSHQEKHEIRQSLFYILHLYAYREGYIDSFFLPIRYLITLFCRN